MFLSNDYSFGVMEWNGYMTFSGVKGGCLACPWRSGVKLIQ